MSTQPKSVPEVRQLRWPGQLVLGMLAAVGIALSIYAGLVIGAVTGLMSGTEGANEPKPGVGLAPDLSGVVKMFVDTGVGGIVGGLAGLLVGGFLVWLICRFALAPLFRRIPGLSLPVSAG